MVFDDHYEELTSDEADFILDLYRVIDELVYIGHPVTLVRLAFELHVTAKELSDYLPIIVSILTKVEQQYAEIR